MVRLAVILSLSRAVKEIGCRIELSAFVDSKYVEVRAGRGGDGCIAFDRFFCNPHGGPSGGDGGNGGHVIFEADASIHDLSHLGTILKAPDGSKGSGSNKHGANAKHLIIPVPLQTQVFSLSQDAEAEQRANLLKVLSKPAERLIAARGGAGGRGNAFLACANQARRDSDLNQRAREATLRLAERGAMGQSRRLLLRILSFADVGLVGLPNAGKSSLLRRLTRARPQVAPYPFTTLQPHVGILEFPQEKGEDPLKITIADLPGIIEGAASHNAGLGACFLSFIERCRALVYVIDVSEVLKERLVNGEARSLSLTSVTDKFTEQLHVLRGELELFNPQLVDSSRVSLVVGTKMDLIVPSSDSQESFEKISQCLEDAAKRAGLKSPQTLLVSALRGDCINDLVDVLSTTILKSN